MKKFLGILSGIVLIAGAIAYYLSQRKKNKNSESTQHFETTEPEVSSSNIENTTLSTEIVQENEEQLDNTKNSAIGNIYYRHNDAADVIKESVNAIRDNIKESKSIDTEMNLISDELDKMLSED